MIRAILILVRKWKAKMVGEAVAGKRLGEMTPDDAAAYIVTHRDDDLTEAEQKQLTSWLSADDSHARALNRAEAVWGWFDHVERDAVLAEIRARSRKARPGHPMRFYAVSSRRGLVRYWRRIIRFLRD